MNNTRLSKSVDVKIKYLFFDDLLISQYKLFNIFHKKKRHFSYGHPIRTEILSLNLYVCNKSNDKLHFRSQDFCTLPKLTASWIDSKKFYSHKKSGNASNDVGFLVSSFVVTLFRGTTLGPQTNQNDNFPIGLYRVYIRIIWDNKHKKKLHKWEPPSYWFKDT